mgnify:CR=1 FL=1
MATAFDSYSSTGAPTRLPRLNVTDIAVTTFVLWLPANSIFLQHRQFVPFEYLQLLSVILCYAGIRLLRPRISIVLGVIAIWSAAETVIAILQLSGCVESNHVLFPVTGSFRNPGPLGGFLALGLTIMFGNISVLRNKKNIFTAVCIFVATAIIAMLIISDSRAGWLAAITGILLLQWQNIHAKLLKLSLLKKFVVTIIIIMLVIILYQHKSQSAEGRLLTWRVTADMIADKPVTGQGIGSFTELYMYYQANYFKQHPDSRFIDCASVVDRPYNDFLRLLSEEGIIGAIILCLMIYGIIVNSKRERRTVNAALASIAVFSMFSYPSYITQFQLSFAALLACTHCSKRPNETGRHALSVAGILMLVFCTYSIFYFHTSMEHAENGLRNFLSTGNSASIDKTIIYNNPRLLDIYATHMSGSKRQEILKIAAIKAPSPNLLCNLATELADSDYVQAEKLLHTAHFMIPYMVRPQYELYRLSAEHGDTAQARTIIKNFLDGHTKVESSAALQMTGEMKRYYKNTSQCKE